MDVVKRGPGRPRKVSVPGDPVSSDTAADDLAEFEPDSLPEGAAEAALAAKVAALEAKLKRMERGSEPSKPAVREPDAMSQAEAEAMAEEAIARGQRPRSLLTPDGWYVHREMARTPGSMGNQMTPKKVQ